MPVLCSWNAACSWKISSMAARRRPGSFSPKTSCRARISKVDTSIAGYLSNAPLCLCVGINQRSGSEVCWRYDRLRPGVFELRQIVAVDVLVLHLEDARLGPAAALAKLHIAQNRLEGVAACELRKLLIVERPRSGDCLFENLHLSVGLRSHVIPERICAGSFSLRLICRNHFCDTRKHHLRHGQPVLVVDDAVQKRAQRSFNRPILGANHRTADNLRLKPYCIYGLEKSCRVVEIGADEQDVRVDRPKLANDWRKISCRQGIFGIRNNLEPMPTCVVSRAGCRTLQEWSIQRKDRH